MTQFAKETLPISLEEEMRRSYLDYAMSVIVGPGPARCTRRLKARASAGAVCHARAEQRLEPPVQEVGTYRR